MCPGRLACLGRLSDCRAPAGPSETSCDAFRLICDAGGRSCYRCHHSTASRRHLHITTPHSFSATNWTRTLAGGGRSGMAKLGQAVVWAGNEMQPGHREYGGDGCRCYVATQCFVGVISPCAAGVWAAASLAPASALPVRGWRRAPACGDALVAHQRQPRHDPGHQDRCTASTVAPAAAVCVVEFVCRKLQP